MIVSELEIDTKETLNDPTQFGNTKGSSTTHYLMKLTDTSYKSTAFGKATTTVQLNHG